jgi:stage II sporulation SpoE-like protein
MPFLIMAVVAAVCVATGGKDAILALLSLGPAFAAIAGGLRYTLITGCVAVALAAVLATYQSFAATRQDSLAFATVAGVTLAGVIASAGRQRRERELADVTAIAEATQQVLLRPVPQQVGDVRLSVRYMSAASGARIGGDLYEVVTTRTGLRLIIGDVQGKGLPAVQTAATVLGAFREAAHDAPSLAVITDRIEASLARQGDREQFVTAILAQVSDDGSAIELLNCGHPAPLLVGHDGARFIEPADPGLPLGLTELAVPDRQPATIEFGAGEAILLYTDGISEARDKHGDFFPLETSGHKALTLPPPAQPAGEQRPGWARRWRRRGGGQPAAGTTPAAGVNGAGNGHAATLGPVGPAVMLPGMTGGLHPSGPAPTGTCPDAMLEQLSNDVVHHVGHALDDDAAMLLLRRDATAQPQRPGKGATVTDAAGAVDLRRYAPGKAEPGAGQAGAGGSRWGSEAATPSSHALTRPHRI